MPSFKTDRTKNRVSTTSMSSTVRITSSKCSQSGRVLKQHKSLNATKIRLEKEAEAKREAERLQAMTAIQLRSLDRLRNIPDAFSGDGDNDYEQDILHGRAAADISHAGEALPSDDADRADAAVMAGLQANHGRLWGRYPDTRTRKNRTQQQVDVFDAQLEHMTDAYLDFSLAIADEGLASALPTPENSSVQETRKVMVVDMFSASHQNLKMITGDFYIASACVQQGWMPCSAYFPNVVITIRTLEVFRVTRLRCPHLGIQAFVRALCDIHGVAPRPWLGTQFSVAFDIYLAVRARVDSRVQAALGRDTPDWRLKNACPACLYKLEGEPHLKEESLADGTTAPGASKELHDNRVAPGDYYLPREDVNKFEKEGVSDVMKSFAVDSENDEGDSGCLDNWQNMKEGVTAHAYGMYDETGFFPALCRHGFVLKVVDMVKSGELSKYPLAITAHLLNALGEIAIGYNIGCKFGKIVKVHPALKELAADKNFCTLVGAFHGHGHGHLCGLNNLMTYVEGVGLEALEICESFFSKSNVLASTTRYASRFHREQAITTYLKHTDTFETYHGLLLLLCSKYKRALEIRATKTTLHATMRELGVESRDVFDTWRAREKTHLRTLSKEPKEETLEMEYLQKLINLWDTQDRVAAILGVATLFVPSTIAAGYAEAASATRRIETQRRHALEVEVRARAAVHDLELQLVIATRWAPGDEKWIEVSAMLSKRRYQRALDHLQGLIITRMFELAKCNMSGTGYKLRKHIAKSLQVRSKAIKTAIGRYNEAAEAMTPPKPTLNWEEVVEYAFLADFDLLREGREDIRGELWAPHKARLTC
ncbi:hypothetical protein B0H14DRAFT_3590063 [Mycena olivaceomarginata]|nr:hypothetical protein B0H14DRAFT_3590063 [Mycena olivaceomarginata]